MIPAHDDELTDRLRDIVAGSAWFMPALRVARALGLQSWCIGAGAVRNLVWDQLHGHATPSELADVDLAYFDPHPVRPDQDAKLQARVQAALPGLTWEVTNQALVHTWFEACFGHPVAPLASLDEAVASWPEYATAVGLWLTDRDAIGVIAPWGLSDLFGMRIRRNPVRVSLDTYRARVAQKHYTRRWPRVIVEPG